MSHFTYGQSPGKKREVSESLAMMKPTSGFSSLDQRGLEQEARRRKDGQREGSAGCPALAGSVSGGRSPRRSASAFTRSVPSGLCLKRQPKVFSNSSPMGGLTPGR